MITRIKEIWHNVTQHILRSLYELLFGNEVRKGALMYSCLSDLLM